MKIGLCQVFNLRIFSVSQIRLFWQIILKVIKNQGNFAFIYPKCINKNQFPA